MQKFEYRTPRFSVDFPVRFTIQNSTLMGRCREISREGMRLEFLEPLPPHSFGTVSLDYQNCSLELNVRVAHAGVAHDGLEFIYETDTERDAVEHLVASLAAIQYQTGRRF